MGSENTWMFKSIAMLSLLGYISLPDSLLNKISSGRIITHDQELEYLKHSEVGYKLISEIPRLEEISQVIKFQNKHYDGSGFPSDDLSGKDIPMGARILKIALDYERFSNITYSNEGALLQLEEHVERYDPKILKLFIKSTSIFRTENIITVSLVELEEGMKIY